MIRQFQRGYLWILNFYCLKSIGYLQDNFSADIFYNPQVYQQVYPQNNTIGPNPSPQQSTTLNPAKVGL